MWFSFWRSRDRFSLDELRYLVDQLMKIQVVNEINKDFVIEALRSIAELITYGDQHDASFFELFMEKQVMGEFVRILNISRTAIVSLQLLQTMSIMIQNLKTEHSIYYMFSNEHVNCLITYSFDFGNEELLSYYISFLRAISGKLNKDTISLLVKTHYDEVVSFPLYVEAIRFAFHEEGMIRTAVRALTLNIYHVGDEAVNNFIAKAPHADYFINLVKFFRDQCIQLDLFVSNASKNLGLEARSSILSAVDEIEDNLYYFSDVISAGIPDVGRLIMDNILKLLIFPLIIPSLKMKSVNDTGLGSLTSLYLLCCILRIVKIKDLANTVAAALLCHVENFTPKSDARFNGHMFGHDSLGAGRNSEENTISSVSNAGTVNVIIPSSSSSQGQPAANSSEHDCGSTHFTIRESLLSCITWGDDVQVSGSLSVLATLLQTKELDESMVDALGILPQRKQHKKLLLQALVGEESGEEKLFALESNVSSVLDYYLETLKDHYGVSCTWPEVGVSPCGHRSQVLDALVSLFCRSDISAETLWDGGWLLRQLLPYSKAEFSSNHLRSLKESLLNCTNLVLEETRGIWPDFLITVLFDEWKRCKRAIEAASPRKDPKWILLPPRKSASEELVCNESSVTAGERMCEIVKVFVLRRHIHIFSLGRVLQDQPVLSSPIDIVEKSCAKNAGVLTSGPKPNTEINLVDAVPCRIAFERGKERHFYFLAISMGSSGWLVLADQLPSKPSSGVVRVTAPLAGCNPKIDDKHLRWLHLRIRPSSFPLNDTSKHTADGKVKAKALVDGRWTLAFRDEKSCKVALSMILDEINLQSLEVERRLKPLLEVEGNLDPSSSNQPVEDNCSSTSPSNSS